MFHSAGEPVGELIVRNGKRTGTRLPLRAVTVIGSAEGCDIRLTGDAVGLAHCVIGLTPNGPALRAGFAGRALVNGSPRDEALLADGDELKVGPCVFQVSWSAPVPQLPPPCETIPTQAAQLAEILDDRQKQVAEHQDQLAEARAEVRRERDRVQADRDEADKLAREAKELHRQAAKERDRAKRLGARFLGRLRRKWHSARVDLAAEKAEVEKLRGQSAEQVALLGIDRTEFHTHTAEAQARLAEAWAELDAQRKRAAAERAEANEYHAKLEAVLEARGADLAGREKALATARIRLEREVDGLRREAIGLDVRIRNTRSVVEELEARRERMQAAALAPTNRKDAAPELFVALDRAKDRDLAAWAAELDARERQLNDDRAALAAVKAGLECEAAELADSRRVLAEQVTVLASARVQWQQAEARTLAEMEELARDLRHREQQTDAREERVLRADARRREDAYELWQLRLRLEGWQAKLTAVERRWHAERELREVEYANRVEAVRLREQGYDETLARWEEAHERDRLRFRTELSQWSHARQAMIEAAAAFDRQRQDVVNELVTHAARATAAEELIAGAVQDGGGERVGRRLEVLRKRWERVFVRARDQIAERQSAAAAEQALLDTRYKELLRLLTEVVERESALTTQAARGELAERAKAPFPVVQVVPASQAVVSGELVTLREEVERMAGVLLAAGVAEVPDSQLPWGVEEAGADKPDVLPFGSASWAA
jgi:hypothetical protein